MHLAKVRVYFSGDNLLTFTEYPKGFFDPEMTDNRGTYEYPVVAIYTFGLNVEF